MARAEEITKDHLAESNVFTVKKYLSLLTFLLDMNVIFLRLSSGYLVRL